MSETDEKIVAKVADMFVGRDEVLGGAEKAECMSQIEVKAGCDLRLKPDSERRACDDYVLSSRVDVTDESVVIGEKPKSYLSEEQRRLLEQSLCSAIRPNELPATRLKQTGAEYRGLLEYYVDDQGITVMSDSVEIESDQVDELLAEIQEIVRIHRAFAERS